MNQPEVVALMESSKSESEWKANCAKVKEAYGDYPSFWYSAIVESGLVDRVAKSIGSSADIKVTSLSRKPIQGLYGRPASMPYLAKGQNVVGVYDQGLGEKDMVCNSLAEMQDLYDSYASGMALRLKWVIDTH